MCFYVSNNQRGVKKSRIHTTLQERIHVENPASSDLDQAAQARHKLAVRCICGTVGEVDIISEPPLTLPICRCRTPTTPTATEQQLLHTLEL